MEKQFFKVGFCVDDVEKEAAFFDRTFGVKIKERLHTPDGDFILLDAGNGNLIELLPHNQLPDSPVGFHHIAFKTENMDEAYAEVKESGASMLSEPFDAGFGITLADLEGPEGTLIRLFHRD